MKFSLNFLLASTGITFSAFGEYLFFLSCDLDYYTKLKTKHNNLLAHSWCPHCSRRQITFLDARVITYKYVSNDFAFFLLNFVVFLSTILFPVNLHIFTLLQLIKRAAFCLLTHIIHKSIGNAESVKKNGK